MSSKTPGNALSNSSNKASGKLAGRELLEGMLRAFTTKDLSKVMTFFTDDAVFYDPHYPQPRMVGKDAIRQGMEWGMSSLEKPGFKVRKIWLDGNSGVAEMDTHHVIRGSMETRFDQVFVFDFRDGKFSRLQSYVPYPPHGIAGMIGNVTKVIWQMQGKMK